MSPANGKLLEFFLSSEARNQSSNWIIYRDLFLYVAGTAGLSSHIETGAMAPVLAAAVPNAPTADEKEGHGKLLMVWNKEEAVVRQGIASTIPDSLFIKVSKEASALAMWNAVKRDKEGRSLMAVVSKRHRLAAEQCDEGGDVRAHVMKLETLHKTYTSMGDVLSENNFSGIILTSLSASYNNLVSALSGSSALSSAAGSITLTPGNLIQATTYEYDWRIADERKKTGGRRKEKAKDDENDAFSGWVSLDRN